jgi:hypothetical protein
MSKMWPYAGMTAEEREEAIARHEAQAQEAKRRAEQAPTRDGGLSMMILQEFGKRPPNKYFKHRGKWRKS